MEENGVFYRRYDDTSSPVLLVFEQHRSNCSIAVVDAGVTVAIAVVA